MIRGTQIQTVIASIEIIAKLRRIAIGYKISTMIIPTKKNRKRQHSRILHILLNLFPNKPVSGCPSNYYRLLLIPFRTSLKTPMIVLRVSGIFYPVVQFISQLQEKSSIPHRHLKPVGPRMDIPTNHIKQFMVQHLSLIAYKAHFQE